MFGEVKLFNGVGIRGWSISRCTFFQLESITQPSGMDREDANVLLKAARNPAFIKDALATLGTGKFTEKDLDNKIAETMIDFNGTFLSGRDNSTTAGINQAVKFLALDLVQKGESYDSAVKDAAKKVVLSRYEIGKINGVKFRVPKSYEGQTLDIYEMEAGAANAQYELAKNPAELELADMKQYGKEALELVGRKIVQQGYWMTSSDETGLLLFIGGSVVRKKDGAPVMYTWPELLVEFRNRDSKPDISEDFNIMGLAIDVSGEK